MNRLMIYSFFDKAGIVDDYVIYQLHAMRDITSKIIVVVNGKLTKQSHTKLSKVCDNVILRDNYGFDAWGYKDALEKIGYNNVAKYDELICMNHTCFGPIFSVVDMFDKMAHQKCDWWSLYSDVCPQNPIPGRHLPSFFIVYRQSLTSSPAFREFWDTMPEITSYSDDVLHYENRQTPFFDLRGFHYTTAFDMSRFDARPDNWPLTQTADILMVDRVPFMKRRPFFIENGNIDGELYNHVIPYIRDNTDYDIQLIAQNLMRTQDIASIRVPSLLRQAKWWLFSPVVKKYRTRIKNIMTTKKFMEILGENNG